jgi:hypothetical protein
MNHLERQEPLTAENAEDAEQSKTKTRKRRKAASGRK